MFFDILFVSQSNKESIIVRNILKKLDCNVFIEVARDKKQAREYLNKRKWHSIVLDYSSASFNIIISVLELLQSKSYNGITAVLLSKECDLKQSAFIDIINTKAVYFFFKEEMDGFISIVRREIDKSIYFDNKAEVVYKESPKGQLSAYVEEMAEVNLFLNFITKNTGEIIYRLDSKGRIIFISQSIEKYGYLAEELIGMYMLELMHEEDKEKALFVINERRRGLRKTRLFEVRLKYGYRKLIKSGDQYFNLLISSEGIYYDFLDRKSFRGTQGIGLDITDYKKVKRKLKHTDDFLKVTTSIIIELCNIKSNNLGVVIERSLGRIADYTGADRAYIFFNNMFLFSDNLMHNYEWKSEVVSSLRDIRASKFKKLEWWKASLEKHGMVSIPDISFLPPEADEERQTLSSFNINSTISISLKYDDRVIGQIGIDSSEKRKREWDKQLIILLSVIAKVIISVLENAKRETALLEQANLLMNIISSVPYPLYVIDSKDHSVKISNTNLSFLNSSDKPALDQRNKADKKLMELIEQAKRNKSKVSALKTYYDREGKSVNKETYVSPLMEDDNEVNLVLMYLLEASASNKVPVS